MDVPPHANSAVDGYAIAHADLSPDGETVLPIGGRAAAGHPLGRAIGRGEAIRIFTGAPMPDGADTVMMQEDCIVAGDRVRLKPGIKPGRQPPPRRRGRRRRASVALAAGRRLRAGRSRPRRGARPSTSCRCYRPLRVALLSTGDEVREPGTALPPGAIYDANRFMLAALLARARLRRQRSRHPSRPRGRARRYAGRGRADARSDRDLGRRLDRRGGPCQGGDRAARRARISGGWRSSPAGRSRWARSRGVPLIGLPGNPVAAALTFAILARPLILRLAGAVEPAAADLPGDAPGLLIAKRPGRREYLRATAGARRRCGDRAANTRRTAPASCRRSSIPTASRSRRGGRRSRPGTMVDFLPFSEVFG